MVSLNVEKNMADIPQSLYKAMKRHSSGLSGQIYAGGCGHAVKLGTLLPMLQGIADKGFSGHPPCSQILFFATVKSMLILSYKAYHKYDSSCGPEIRINRNNTITVILTELPNNPGITVTPAS
jgi:hypothetical protein